jgi:hypothetical protein
MAEENLKTLYLFRTGQLITSSDSDKSAIGVRGVLVAGEATYHTIERGGNYVTLPIGEYEIKMEESPTKWEGKNPRRQFRVLGHNVYSAEHGRLAALLMHTGNYPHQIVGCIAPGKSYLSNGVGESRQAMQEIFNYCGGFGIGKKALLVVDKIEI